MSSDSEDEVPLAQRQENLVTALPKATTASLCSNGSPSIHPRASAPNCLHVAKEMTATQRGTAPVVVVPKKSSFLDESDSDDDVPLGNRMASVRQNPSDAAPPANSQAASAAPKATIKKPAPVLEAKVLKRPAVLDDAVMLPTAPKPKPPAPKATVKAEPESDSDSDIPLAKRRQSMSTADRKPAVKRAKSESTVERKAAPKRKAPRSDSEPSEAKRSRGAQPQNGDEKKWDTLKHCGVLFPPEYEPHGVKMLYDGVPVDLTPEQEEVASFFAVMRDTDYMNKPTFLNNFWEGFKEVLGPKHVIRSLDKCDFTPIYEYHMAERERKKNLSKEEKARIKKEKDEAEAKYKVAYVDGKPEPVGNFRVELPGLFRGRGEHPKMGKIKRRVYPQDITINIGKGEPVPEHPFPGQTWKEVRHDNTVTWLAMWRDPVNTKETKYVFLGATSSWKADSDLQKYEKARKLKDFIDDIRTTYRRNWDAKDRQERQMATALYFIDILALRAGHEKDEDEADTVGCCTLKVENVECLPPNHIKFDFLGKDSIRYENTVEVDTKVFKNVELFMREDAAGRRKKGSEQLFDAMDAGDLNKRLKELMDGLSVKVFRTYNASIVLDRLLNEPSQAETVDAKKAEYDFANKEVAILCNHQRSIPKSHSNQMDKLREKVEQFQHDLEDLQKKLKLARQGKTDADGKKLNEDRLKDMIAKKKAQIMKTELESEKKEALKTVALGTSKINYLDPRITVAWCKRNEVPIEKVFNKSLLGKFLWSMDCDHEFRF